jgi:hypothetical protein
MEEVNITKIYCNTYVNITLCPLYNYYVLIKELFSQPKFRLHLTMLNIYHQVHFPKLWWIFLTIESISKSQMQNAKSFLAHCLRF